MSWYGWPFIAAIDYSGIAPLQDIKYINTSGTGVAFKNPYIVEGPYYKDSIGTMDIIPATEQISFEKINKLIKESEEIKKMVSDFYDAVGNIKSEILNPKEGIKCKRCCVIDNLSVMIDGTYRCDRCIDKSSDIESRHIVNNNTKRLMENNDKIEQISLSMEKYTEALKAKYNEIIGNKKISGLSDGYSDFSFAKSFMAGNPTKF